MELHSNRRYYSKIFYKFKVNVGLIVADDGSNEDYTNWALLQATDFAIMDFYNQYTYAKTTATMLAEIAYTREITIFSTLISAGIIAGVSIAASLGGVSNVLARVALAVGKTALATVAETMEELFIDSYIEAWVARQAEIHGWDMNLEFWLSSLLTSIRETGMGPLFQMGKGISQRMQSNVNTELSLDLQKIGEMTQGIDLANDPMATEKLSQEMVNQMEQEITKKITDKADIKSWRKIVASKVLKGLLYAGSSMVLLGGTAGSMIATFSLGSIPFNIGIDMFTQAETLQKISRKVDKNMAKIKATFTLNL
ncbi:hypothetical protein ES708_21222 [subsurface metagenome]